jgi:hypothetical protein
MENQPQQTLSKEAVANDYVLTTGGFMIIGSELVGEKMTALIAEAVNSFDQSAVTTIVLRNDGYPADWDDKGATPIFGRAFPDSHSIAISVSRCFDRAAEIAMKGDKYLSFTGLLWVNIISAIGHELDHLVIANTDRELYETMRLLDGGKDLEASAKDSERQLICTLARDFDVEMPPVAEMGWLGVEIMNLFTNKDTKDLPWVDKARKMLEAGHVYYEDVNELECFTFREFVKQAYSQDGEGWDQPTTPCHLNMYIEEGTAAVELVAVAETVEQPKVDEVVAAAVEVVMKPQADGMFVGAGIEVDSGEPDIVIAEEEPESPLDAIETEAGGIITPEVVDRGIAALAAANPTLPAAPAATVVPLAPNVANQEAVFAAAVDASVPAAAAAPTTYAVNNITPEVMKAMLQEVWTRLYAHVFTKCGWQQHPESGRYFFAKPANVVEHVNIQDILSKYGVSDFIMEYDTVNAAGQTDPVAEMCNGTIRGFCSSKANLPCYAIYLNIGGQRFKRVLTPQNPEKQNAQNAYTATASEAAVGHQIAWVWKDEAAQGASFPEKCAVKITNSTAGINYEIIQ